MANVFLDPSRLAVARRGNITADADAAQAARDVAVADAVLAALAGAPRTIWELVPLCRASAAASFSEVAVAARALIAAGKIRGDAGGYRVA